MPRSSAVLLAARQRARPCSLPCPPTRLAPVVPVEGPSVPSAALASRSSARPPRNRPCHAKALAPVALLAAAVSRRRGAAANCGARRWSRCRRGPRRPPCHWSPLKGGEAAAPLALLAPTRALVTDRRRHCRRYPLHTFPSRRQANRRLGLPTVSPAAGPKQVPGGPWSRCRKPETPASGPGFGRIGSGGEGSRLIAALQLPRAQGPLLPRPDLGRRKGPLDLGRRLPGARSRPTATLRPLSGRRPCWAQRTPPRPAATARRTADSSALVLTAAGTPLRQARSVPPPRCAAACLPRPPVHQRALRLQLLPPPRQQLSSSTMGIDARPAPCLQERRR